MRDLDKKVLLYKMQEENLALDSIERIMHNDEIVFKLTFVYEGLVFSLDCFVKEGNGSFIDELVASMKDKKKSFLNLHGMELTKTHINMIADTIYARDGYSLYSTKKLFGGYQTIQKAVILYIEKHSLKPLCRKDFPGLYNRCINEIDPADYDCSIMSEDDSEYI